MQFLERPGRPRLGFRVDAARGASRARVLLIHGYADHLARFDHVTADWNERGLTVGRLDLTGHGTSEGPRGHVEAFDDYLGDVRDVLGALDKEAAWASTAEKPILFGHSMGALIAAHTALLMGDRIAGLAMTSPFLAVAKQVPLQIPIARIVSRFAPALKQPSGLRGQDLCHDAAIVASYDTDSLRFNHVTVGWFAATSRAQEELFARAKALRARLYCIAAGDDRVVSLAATRRFFDLVGSVEKDLEVREGLFHEVLNEPDWRDHSEKLATRMLRWVP